MSERNLGEVTYTLKYITNPELILDDYEEGSDFADELYQFCEGAELPKNPTKDDIRLYAVMLFTAYGGWLMSDWEDGGCSVYEVVKEEIDKRNKEKRV